MNSVKCLITGCNFVDPIGQKWIHGDLHQLLDILIFNANGCEWQFEPMVTTDMAVLCPDFYEKNNQIVFPLQLAQFNLAANMYVNGMLEREKEQAKLARNIANMHRKNKTNGHEH
jgi:hypothetical protein